MVLVISSNILCASDIYVFSIFALWINGFFRRDYERGSRALLDFDNNSREINLDEVVGLMGKIETQITDL